MSIPTQEKLSVGETEALIKTLSARFKKNMDRHAGLMWPQVEEKLWASPGKIWSLNEMERTDGEPDATGIDQNTGEYIFYDCAAESPKGRRSLCYDDAALESRKDFPPKGSATGTALAMGIELLDEDAYRHLQTLGTFDEKTSSWISTPKAMRDLGGALFADYRFRRVFFYHNGAQSYYAARGFRGRLRV